jgi:competence protein ComFB
MEEAVFAEIEQICASMEDEIRRGNKQYEGVCTCAYCRLDAACYVLNRIKPSYIVSGRGITHAARDTFEKQQKMTDISILVYEAMLQVGHNRRPNIDHHAAKDKPPPAPRGIFFNIPAIYGRILHGCNFAPMNGIDVYLFYEGQAVRMKNVNWNNPCKLNDKTEGAYTFWPEAVQARCLGETKAFNYQVQAEAPGFEPLRHSFVIPVESDGTSDTSFSMSRAFQLTDLYMFPCESAAPEQAPRKTLSPAC